MSTKLLRLWPVAVVVMMAGCSSSPGSKVAPSTTTTTGATAVTVSTIAPTTTGASTTTSTSTAPAGGPLPAGLTVADLTWVSDNQGWALGAAPCSHPPCTSVVHTLDGGHTWAGLPAPHAYLDGDSTPASAPPCSTTVACVHGIRFADAHIGYAFGVSSLWLTTDGGHTWSQRSNDPTDALEITHGVVARVTHPGGIGCPPGCPYRVQTTPVGSTSWHSVPAPDLVGLGAALAVEGSNLYQAAFGHRAGGASDAHTQFTRSTDNGGHWSSFADPCTLTPSGNEADATVISAAPGGILAVGCTARVSGEAGFVVVSADAGATFGPHRGGLLGVVPADGEFVDRIAAATGRQIAVLVDSSAGRNIVVTNDAGADWTATHTEPPAGFKAPSDVYLGFQDATTGRAVIVPRTVLTTTDGGGHWTPFIFP